MTSITLSATKLRRLWRPSRRWLIAAWGAWVGVALLAVGLSLAGIPARQREILAPQGLPVLAVSPSVYASILLGSEVAVALVFFLTAAILARYKPDDLMVLFLGLTLMAIGATETSLTGALVSPDHSPVWTFWRWPVWALQALAMTGMLVLLYVFPDGRFTPPWTRWLALGWAILNVLWLCFPRLPFNTIHGGTWRATPVASLLVGLAWFGTGVYAQVYRYRHVPDAIQHLQTKWTVAGLLVAVLGGLVSYGFLGFIGYLDLSSKFLGELYFLVRPVVANVLLALMPVCIGIAVLRHHLFDIDVIVNRALVYSALTASVVAIYVLVVGSLGALFQARGNLAISLLATAIVAVLFHPWRERLQRIVNRFMYGERDEPYAVLARLGQRLEATLALDAVLPTIVETVATALKLPYAAILLQQDDQLVLAAEWRGGEGESRRGGDAEKAHGSPSHPPAPSPSPLVTLPLMHQGEIVGHLRLAPRAPGEALSRADQRLLDDLARQAGMAVQAVRLNADLQRLNAELQQARERLVSAREEERRRIRRDLHDGLGPTLASLTFKLDAARNLLPRDPERTDALLASISDQAQDTIGKIRRLVYDLRPPTLDELGLVAALREQAALQQGPDLRIAVEAPEHLPSLPAAVEVAAYRIVQEALTNVVRHARARTCRVRLALPAPDPNGSENALGLTIEISDDGAGLDTNDHHSGVGLRAMRERATELGGTFVIDSAPGRGTRVRARLPLTDANGRAERVPAPRPSGT